MMMTKRKSHLIEWKFCLEFDLSHGTTQKVDKILKNCNMSTITYNKRIIIKNCVLKEKEADQSYACMHEIVNPTK
jgi:hypothetical protein